MIVCSLIVDVSTEKERERERTRKQRICSRSKRRKWEIGVWIGVRTVLEKLRYGSSSFTQGDRPIASVEIAGPKGESLPDETGLGRRHVSLVSCCNENGFERSLLYFERSHHFPIADHWIRPTTSFLDLPIIHRERGGGGGEGGE